METVIAIVALIIAVIALFTRRLDANLHNRVTILEGMLGRLWRIEMFLRDKSKIRGGTNGSRQ